MSVARIVVLDTGPLWLVTMPQVHPTAGPCHAWLASIDAAGAIVVIPAVADYEVRRELVRRGASSKLVSLDGLVARFGRLPVSDAAWDLAAVIWAQVRSIRGPTAGPDSRDADAIFAGQAWTADQPTMTGRREVETKSCA